jgi:hypothetical protein
MAERWKIEPGTYEYTRSDGSNGVTKVAADGTYTSTAKDGTSESGTWHDEGEWSRIVPTSGAERRYAFTPPDAQGEFTGTMESGLTANLRRVS